MSKYVDQIISVVKYLKNDILTKLDNDKEVLEEDVNGIIREAFKNCATLFDVKESTIRDKATRQSFMNTMEFFELTKKFLLEQDQQLVDTIVKYSKKTDSEADIRNQFKNI